MPGLCSPCDPPSDTTASGLPRVGLSVDSLDPASVLQQLDNGQLNHSHRVDSQGGSLLHHFAAHENDIEIVRRLLEANFDPNLRNAQGATPLHTAAACGSVSTIQLLIQCGAAKDVEDAFGMNPQGVAEVFGHDSMVLELLDVEEPAEGQH